MKSLKISLVDPSKAAEGVGSQILVGFHEFRDNEPDLLGFALILSCLVPPIVEAECLPWSLKATELRWDWSCLQRDGTISKYKSKFLKLSKLAENR